MLDTPERDVRVLHAWPHNADCLRAPRHATEVVEGAYSHPGVVSEVHTEDSIILMR
jgi:hypothetical protein